MKWQILVAAQRLALCPVGVLVGGMRQRHFDGTHSKPRKLPENAQTPTITTLVIVQGSGAAMLGRTLIVAYHEP